MKTLALTLATMMTGCVAMTAHATAPAVQVHQELVSYDDLNLQSEFGAGTLLIRIKFAARRVCGLANPVLMQPSFADRLQSCTEESTARAVAEIGAPLLTRRAIRFGVIERPADVARSESGAVAVRVATSTRM